MSIIDYYSLLMIIIEWVRGNAINISSHTCAHVLT